MVITNYTPQVTILRKIRGNSQEYFTGKSGENVGSYSEEFLVTLPRDQVLGISCNPFRGNSHNSFQGISCDQYQGISCYRFCRKTRENLWKFMGISCKMFFRTNSWEFPRFPRFSQEFLRNILKYSQHIPE